MADTEKIIREIVKAAGSAAGVPVYHTPSPSAGEKIIYRCIHGEYDGEFESVTLVMRFISRDLAAAMSRAQAVAGVICRRGERGIEYDREKVYGIREEGGTSGFIGRTGHFYVMSRFRIKFRRTCAERYAIFRPVE